jgi:hypothetical protein
MNPSLIDVLFRPDDFFSNLKTKSESLKIPALIILAGGIVAAIYGYLVAGMSAKMMAGITPGIESILPLVAIPSTIIITFIVWLIMAGVFYLVSLLFRGQGSFNRVLEVTGYGYLPQIAGSFITAIAAMVYIPKITVPTLTMAALQDTAMTQQVQKAFMHDPAMMQLTQIVTLVSIVCLLLSAHIWIFGIKHARSLSPRDAAICVGVPIVLYVLYLTYNLGVM